MTVFRPSGISVKTREDLVEGTARTQTTLNIDPIITKDGTRVTMAHIGDIGFAKIDQGTSNEEIISFTGITDNTDTYQLTGCVWGYEFHSTTSAVTANKKKHVAGASFLITNDDHFLATQYVNFDGAQTISGKKTFSTVPASTAAPTANDDLVNKNYADTLVLGVLTTINVIVPGTAGETVAAGNVIYFDLTDNEWKLTDADTAATVNNVQLGIAQGAGTDGNPISGGVMLQGVDTNQTGLTEGDVQYIANTAGGISTSPGTVEVTVGIAKSATDLYVSFRFDQQLSEDEQDALAGTSGTPSSLNKYLTEDDVEDDGVDQSQTTQNATVAVGEADATTKYNEIAQSFVADKTSITGVKLYKSANTGTFTGDVVVALYANSGGNPTGSALATVTIDNAAYLALSTGEFTATFSSAYAGTIGTTYHIVISPSTSDNSNHPNLGTNSAGGYTSGSVKFNNTTDGWVAIATIDLYFKTITEIASKIVRRDSSSQIIVNETPTADGHAASKSYVDAARSTFKVFSATRDNQAGEGAVNYAHGLGATPSFVRITARLVIGATDMYSYGCYDGTTTRSIAGRAGTAVENIGTEFIVRTFDGTNSHSASITVNSTNVTLTWSKGTTPAAGTIHLVFEVLY